MKKATLLAIDTLLKRLEKEANDNIWLYLEIRHLNDIEMSIIEARKEIEVMRNIVFEQCMPNSPQSLLDKPVLQALGLENYQYYNFLDYQEV